MAAPPPESYMMNLMDDISQDGWSTLVFWDDSSYSDQPETWSGVYGNQYDQYLLHTCSMMISGHPMCMWKLSKQRLVDPTV